jgi:hypothetical protein
MQVYRGQTPGEDLIAPRDEPAPHGMTPLLAPVMRRVPRGPPGPPDDIAADRRRCAEDLDRLPPRPAGSTSRRYRHLGPALRTLATQLGADLASHSALVIGSRSARVVH